MTHEPQHTWTLDKNSLPISVYTKVWGFSAHNANFCKLFWAFIFLPLGLILLGSQNFFSGIGATFKWVANKIPDSPVIVPKVHTDEWYEIRKLRNEIKKIRKQIARLRKTERARKRREFFEKLEAFFSPKADRVAAFFQAHDWVGGALLVLPALGGVYVIIAAAIENTTVFLIVLAALIALVALVYLFVTLSDKGVLGKANQKFVIGFGNTVDFLSVGFKAVKDRTCPGVVVPGVTDQKEKDEPAWSD